MPWRAIVRWIGLIVLGTLILGAYWLTAGDVHNADCFAYAEVAQRMLQGDKLYSEAWQDKPPLAILFYFVPQMVLPGSGGAIQVWLGVWAILQGAVAIACSGPLSSLLQRCTLLVALVLLPLSTNDFVWAATVNTANLFIVVVLLFSYRLVKEGTIPLLAMAGVGICLTFMFNIRQNSVLFGVVPVAAILLSHVERRQTAVRLALLAGGAVAGWTVILGIVLCTSSLPDYFETVFLYPRRYATATGRQTGTDSLVPLMASLLRSPLGMIGAILVPLGLADEWRAALKVKLLLSTALLAGGLLCILPLKAYPHYWANLIPVAALLAFDYAGGGNQPIGNYPRRRERVVLYTTFGGLLAAFAVLHCVEARRMALKYASLDEVAATVNQVTTPADSLYVLSYNGAYLCYGTTARPAHRFFCCFQLDPYWSRILPENINDVLADYERNPPTIIVADVNVYENSPRGLNMVALARRLLERYDYALVDNVQGHWIMKLRSDEAVDRSIGSVNAGGEGGL